MARSLRNHAHQRHRRAGRRLRAVQHRGAQGRRGRDPRHGLRAGRLLLGRPRRRARRLGAALPLAGDGHPGRRRGAGHPDRHRRPVRRPDRRRRPAHRPRRSLPTVAADNLQGARAGGRPPAEPRPHAASAWSPAGRTWSPPSCASRATARRCAAAGIAVDESLLRTRCASSPSTRARLHASCCRSRIHRPRSSRPTTSPRSATLEVAAELGIDVPRQLSVLGFDNIPESALARPAADDRRAAHPADGPRRHRDAHRV